MPSHPRNQYECLHVQDIFGTFLSLFLVVLCLEVPLYRTNKERRRPLELTNCPIRCNRRNESASFFIVELSDKFSLLYRHFFFFLLYSSSHHFLYFSSISILVLMLYSFTSFLFWRYQKIVWFSSDIELKYFQSNKLFYYNELFIANFWDKLFS